MCDIFALPQCHLYSVFYADAGYLYVIYTLKSSYSRVFGWLFSFVWEFRVKNIFFIYIFALCSADLFYSYRYMCYLYVIYIIKSTYFGLTVPEEVLWGVFYHF